MHKKLWHYDISQLFVSPTDFLQPTLSNFDFMQTFSNRLSPTDFIQPTEIVSINNEIVLIDKYFLKSSLKKLDKVGWRKSVG